jgi:hypothetical protein
MIKDVIIAVAVDRTGFVEYGIAMALSALLKKDSGRLFATTSSFYMKDTLLRFGFMSKGKEWKGKKGILSFWQKE